MSPDRRCRWTDDQGMVALEFAIVAPVFLLLVMGVMVFALYFTTLVAVVHGAAEGARASVGGLAPAERDSLAAARVRQVFQGYAPLVDPAAVQVTSGPATIAGAFTVRVSYPLDRMAAGPFWRLMASAGSRTTAPRAVAYSITVANGGY